MSNVTCQAKSQNVYIWKNSDGTFKYINKEGASGGAESSNGSGFGFQFSLPNDAGGQDTYTDTHWVTGGGAGGSVYKGAKEGLKEPGADGRIIHLWCWWNGLL